MQEVQDDVISSALSLSHLSGFMRASGSYCRSRRGFRVELTCASGLRSAKRLEPCERPGYQSGWLRIPSFFAHMTSSMQAPPVLSSQLLSASTSSTRPPFSCRASSAHSPVWHSSSSCSAGRNATVSGRAAQHKVSLENIAATGKRDKGLNCYTGGMTHALEKTTTPVSPESLPCARSLQP